MNGKKISRLALVLFFIAGGAAHFIYDYEFVRIVPPIFPYPLEIVWATGILELLFAGALLQSNRLPLIGRLLSLYLLAVLPANIYMAIAHIAMFSDYSLTWAAWLRVALQFPLIAWILWATDGGWRRA